MCKIRELRMGRIICFSCYANEIDLEGVLLDEAAGIPVSSIWAGVQVRVFSNHAKNCSIESAPTTVFVCGYL